MECLFCQFLHPESSQAKSIVFSDEHVFVLNDHAPQAPIHQLIIPKKHIATLNTLSEEDTNLIGHCVQVARKQAYETNIAEAGYRLIWNCNSAGGQMVYHIHLHLLGGRQLMWPPG